MLIQSGKAARIQIYLKKIKQTKQQHNDSETDFEIIQSEKNLRGKM